MSSWSYRGGNRYGLWAC